MKTLAQYTKELEAKIAALEKNDKPLEIATRSVMALQARRIFIQGKASDNSSIGKYSTKDIYISPSNSPKKFPLKGKDGKTKFKNGNLHKTGYFKGYEGFRKAIGRPTSPVNLTLSGELLKNFSNANSTGEARPVKINQHYYVVRLRENNFKKVTGNEEHFGKRIFNLSRSEKDKFKEIITKELARALQ